MENIDWAWLYTSFEGRINRAKFWLGVVGIIVVEVVAIAIVGVVNSAAINILAFLVYLALIYAGLAVSVKRWHDRGKSGWWVLIGLVPIIGPIWALVETGFLPGTPGENPYGPDPLASS